MKKVYLTFAIFALCFVSCKEETDKKTNSIVETDTMETDTMETDTMETDTVATNDPVPEIPMDSAAVQKAWEKYMTPGKVHKMLAADEGTWTNEMTFWMAPGATPQKATSTAEIKMILGGRYQKTKYQGNMMGMPFKGMATVAYDNETNELISTWIDNMGTGMLILRGKYDAASKSFNLTGPMVDLITGKEIEVREVFTIVDENTRKMEMFHTLKNGEEYKSMEIVMTRK